MSENLEDYELDYLIDVVKKDIMEFNSEISLPQEQKIVKDFLDKVLKKLINQQKQIK